MRHRIRYLDGFRGLAILLVFAFHLLRQYADGLPYGDYYAGFVLVRFGDLGVHLFFLISGFVILMTLESCRGPGEFLYRRWLRLFPGMLLCSLLIYFSADLLGERPRGVPGVANLVPGLPFVDPYWLEYATGLVIEDLEGVFWSLHVEAKFCLFSALSYFALGSRGLVVLLGLCLFAWITSATLAHSQFAPLRWPHELFDAAGFHHFGWFAAGAACYPYHRSAARRWLAFAAAMAATSAFTYRGGSAAEIAAAMTIALVFGATVVSSPLQRLAASRVLLFFGFVSYPFYLLHENMAVSVVAQLGRASPGWPDLLYPAAALALVTALAFAVARYGEPTLRRGIRRALAAAAALRGR